MSKIIVAGAGFGGVRAALDLLKCLPNEQITLINDSEYHCFHADLYEILSASLKTEGRIDFKNLKGTVSIPLKQIFKNKQSFPFLNKRQKIEILVDKITNIDLENNFLETKSKKIAFDFLILALGSKTNYYDVDGAQEFSHPLKTTEDALNIRNDLEELYGRKDKASIVVAGGGYTGVEISGQLSHFLKSKKSNANIKIIEASNKLLSGMSEWAQDLSYKRIKKLGIEVILNHPIEKVEKDKIFSKGDEFLYDYLIWTAGVTGENLNNKILGLDLSRTQKIETQEDLSLKEFPNVFVIGDLAGCLDKKRGCPIASTAWAAISQGKKAAENVHAKVMGKKTSIFISPVPVFVIPIGKIFAISDFLNLKITGFLGWFLKRLVALNYFLSILPFFEALNLWGKGVNLYLEDER